MSQEITDAMLDEQARILARKRYPDKINIYGTKNPTTLTKMNLRAGHIDATRTALEVERESLRLLTTVVSPKDVDAHIQVLRTRLGINLE